MTIPYSQPKLNELTPGSPEENRCFMALQEKLGPMYERVFFNPQAPRTVVVVPSHSLDTEVLAKITGIHHYEERMLCLLMLLRFPRTKVIFITSQPIHDSIIDYYLHLLPGIPSKHARRRLTMLSCHDASPIPLTQKILMRPRLMQRIVESIVNPDSSHITCFNASPLERTLAVQLEIPLYACDPDLCYLGSKSNGREIFQAAGVDIPAGFEHLRDEQDLVQSLATLKRRDPALRRAVVKINEGFSGEGNAIFDYNGHADDHSISEHKLEERIKTSLPQHIKFEAQDMTWPQFKRKFGEMGGIVESWIEGADKRSPSVQCRIDPLGEPMIVSTHDQILGGPSGQIFLGCSFPADNAYRLEIQEAGMRIASQLQQHNVLGRFGADFISVKTDQGWKHYAIEINLRKGGTTLPFMMLQYLTNGEYDIETGLFRTPTGQPRYYYASDNMQKLTYRGLTPDDLIDTMIYNNLHFHSASQQGVVFHLMGALSEFGKFGVVCIDENLKQANQLYNKTMSTLDRETNGYRLPT